MAAGRLAGLISSILPGLFLVGYVIGTGSVTTMASAGASFGMSLVWTLALASAFMHIMVVAIDRTTVVSGRTLLGNFRENFGAAPTLFIMFGMTMTQITSIMGVMAIVTDVVREWSRPFTSGGAGIPPLLTAVVFTAILVGLFWDGRQESFLKVLSALVAAMGVSFVFTALLVAPHWTTILAGLKPSIPGEGNPQLLIAGMVGTTMASVCLFARSIVVKEKGWGPADLGIAQRDSMISATLMFVINTAIVACAAGTMFLHGMKVTHAIDMVTTLEPLAGRMAVNGFVAGIVAAGLSSLFPNYLLGVWMLSDFTGRKRDLGSPAIRALVVITALAGLVVPVFGGRPVQIMIASQAVSPLIMPLMALFIMILLLRTGFVGSHRSSPLLKVSLGVTVAFCLYMLALAVQGWGALFAQK